jgi:pSer/pThr/pTyr-binding forkhead associated (FHA) protein
MPRIQYTTPDGASGEVELSSERMSIGRADDNAIVIADGSVSSHHGEVAFEGGAWVLTDLGSTNGTKVSGNRVDRVELASGSSFTLGSVECVFLGDGDDAASYAEESAPAAPSRSVTASSGDIGSRPYDRSARRGFGPKRKEKDSGRSMLMLLGFVALLVCAAAAFMFTKMGA